MTVAGAVVVGAAVFDVGAVAGDALRGWEAGAATVHQTPQLIPVYEEDAPTDKLIGEYTVDQLAIICGYGLGDGYEVVTVLPTGRMGYAPVSDRRCR